MSEVTRPRSRLYRWAVLPRVEVRWSGLVLEMRYVPSRATWQELEVLVAAERAACPWLVWGLSVDRGWPLVRIEATAADVAAVAAIAFVFTGGAAGPAAVLEGLRAARRYDEQPSLDGALVRPGVGEAGTSTTAATRRRTVIGPAAAVWPEP